MVQPSSVDVRLDRYFRLFDNHKYPFIDPGRRPARAHPPHRGRPDEPFILHPGEFVLGSTFELVSLPTTSPPASRASRRSAAWAC